MTMTAKVKGQLGVPSLGPFSLSLDVDGGITGTVGQSHVLRDALFADATGGPMRGATGLTVRPRTDGSAGLTETTATLHLSIDLWFGSLTWDLRIFTIPGATLASYDSDNDHTWGEGSTLRIGTGSSAGDPMKNPDAWTHVPGQDEVPSFGPGADVDACLAEPPDTRPSPPPCKPTSTPDTPPTANLCAYAYVQLPDLACMDIAATVRAMGVTGDMAQCWTQYLTFLCTPTSFRGDGVVSHIMDDAVRDLTTNWTQYGGVVNTCVSAAVPKTGDDAADAASAKAFVSSFFLMSLCDASGRPIDGSGILGPVGDPSKAPTPTPPGTCP
jgi:hypothetical protein